MPRRASHAKASRPTTTVSPPKPWSVPRLWPGETVVIVGAGPSLTQEQIDCCRGRARMICINRSHELAPWADWLHACDGRFWESYPDAYRFPGIKTTLEPSAARDGVRLFKGSGDLGFDSDSRHVRTGGNSGYQAACIAMHAGAGRIILIGMDCRAVDKRNHWHRRHIGKANDPGDNNYASWRNNWRTLVAPLRARKIEALNATPGSAIDCFPRSSLEEALSS